MIHDDGVHLTSDLDCSKQTATDFVYSWHHEGYIRLLSEVIILYKKYNKVYIIP